jgi:hypothetical protein
MVGAFLPCHLPGDVDQGTHRVFVLLYYKTKQYNDLRSATGGRVTERHVWPAVTTNGERATGKRQRSAERRERCRSQLSQGPKSLKSGCFVHGFSDWFTVGSGKRHASLYCQLSRARKLHTPSPLVNRSM